LRQILFAMILTTSAALAQEPPPQTAPTIPFDSVPDFLKLPPDVYLGEAAGVAVDSKGHVFVFSRGGTSGPAYGAAAAQLLEFDGDGRFVREIGRNLYAWSFAHAVRIDKEDNIWAVDKGSDMVIKFNPDGRVMMVFGRKKEASDEADGPWAHPRPPAPPVDGMFRQVTDVAWDPAGNTYISDGYIIPASPSTMRTEIGLSRGASLGQGLDNSGFCIRFRPTPRATSTLRTAAMGAFRSLTATET
jgi:hypothetical protein